MSVGILPYWRGGSVADRITRPIAVVTTILRRYSSELFKMAARAPKQWALTKHETITSFENWRQNLEYSLSLDSSFSPFLIPGTTWLPKSRENPLRGFEDDGSAIAAENRRTAVQKSAQLDLMLGQIANFCPVIARNTITKTSISLGHIWQNIRLHFGFQTSGAHFLDLAGISQGSEERPEDLYQRLLAFVSDNLLKPEFGISHHGQVPTEEEELSPTLENFIVLQWLRLLHPNLPSLVKQRYGPELRSRTLASLKPEISQALDSLLGELNTAEDAKILRAAAASAKSRASPSPATPKPWMTPGVTRPQTQRRNGRPSQRSCALCQAAGRPGSESHFLSRCRYLPEADRRFFSGVRLIVGCEGDVGDDHDESDALADLQVSDTDAVPAVPQISGPIRRVQTASSPHLIVFYAHNPLRLTLDTGAEVNLIRNSVAVKLGANISPTSQTAYQADGHSALTIVGETRLLLHREHHTLKLDALVVSDLDVDVLAGAPFMRSNDVSVRPAACTVSIGDSVAFRYDCGASAVPDTPVARRAVCTLRAPVSQTIWPGDYLELTAPDFAPESCISVEPTLSSPRQGDVTEPWPCPTVTQLVAGKIRIPNLSVSPVHIRQHGHLCKIYSVTSPNTEPVHLPSELSVPPAPTPYAHVGAARIDPDGILPPSIRSQFTDLMDEYSSVFEPSFPGYNGAKGPIKGVVNIGPVQPPQRPGRVPQYERSRLNELQTKFDELEALGVFRKPEDVGVVVEHVNPSFLVHKAGGGTRLVTDFSPVSQYCKPQPSLMPDVESTLRTIGGWRFLISTDLTKAYHQLPLSRASMKFCGVSTPYKGTRVYTRCAMGIPGSESALEELMCRVLGDLVQEGRVVKLADDLFCGGNSPQEALDNWRLVLEALHACDLRLSASKTVICPRSTTVLGWIWSEGCISASSHRISALATCQLPKTVKNMRSFIGAYKALSRVIPHTANILSPLETVCAGCDSSDRIVWSEDLTAAFSAAQKSLKTQRSVVLPRPTDQLWIVTDGSVKERGIGATLYLSRNGTMHLAGFFSAKIRKNQITWLPCEVEALGIAAATKHFAPYIMQSSTPVTVLTDSKPCVQAYQKLARGEFSASPRVTTFLSTISRFGLSVLHLAGSDNIPSDFASRNAADCTDPSCQVCSFVSSLEEAPVRQISAQDVMSGIARMPFLSRQTWLQTQQDCSDLRRTKAHLGQGTRPSKKQTKIRDVKRYLQVTSLARDGLLVVKRPEPFAPSRECIVVPRSAVPGLLQAIHLKLAHPTQHQLKQVFTRYFYALDLDSQLSSLYESCHTCASLRKLPPPLVESSTSAPTTVGSHYSGDVMHYYRQRILLVRETVTGFTLTSLIPDETAESLESALVSLCSFLRSPDGPPVTIRVDPAPGFVRLQSSKALSQIGVQLEIGRIKNPNKNPIAEHAIGELRDELKRANPDGGAVSIPLLSVVTSRLNSRLRGSGMSSREMLFSRDQFTNSAFDITDRELIANQNTSRLENHRYDYVSKSRVKRPLKSAQVQAGDLVYLAQDRDKSRPRDRYLVISVSDQWCEVRKFTGSQLRAKTYTVRLNECFHVPSAIPTSHPAELSSSDQSDNDSIADCTPVEVRESPPSFPAVPSPPCSTSDLSACPAPPPPVVPPVLSPSSVPGLNPRPRRTVRPPAHLRDFVLS